MIFGKIGDKCILHVIFNVQMENGNGNITLPKLIFMKKYI